MRKIIVLSFISLDGVMQSPGGPEEDTGDDFPYGGWSTSYWDEFLEEEMGNQMGQSFDLLLGRKTYDIFEANWPIIDSKNVINTAKKYVVTSKPIANPTEIWKNSISVNGDIAKQIKALKDENGFDLHVHGSSKLIQTLMENELVDEFWLKIYPVTLGKGKRLFASGTVPTAFKVKNFKITPKGVILVKYEKSGDVELGTF